MDCPQSILLPKKYQGVYKSECLTEYKTIDDVHDSDYMTNMETKKNLVYQKDLVVNSLLKKKIYDNITTAKDFPLKTKQEYAQNWLSLPEDSFNKLCWIQFANCQKNKDEKTYLASGCLKLMKQWIHSWVINI